MRMKVDSDSEENSDHDVAVQFSSVTRSVFNITLDIPDDEEQETKERTDYEQRLNAEIDAWLSLLKKTKQEISNSTAAHHTDCSVLSPEKLAYLRRAPDLNRFIEESMEFRREAREYLEVDYEEVLEMHENLVQLCANHLDNKKSQLVEQYIFNVPTVHHKIN